LRKCKNCGKEFEAVDKMHPFQIFCSYRCKQSYYQKAYYVSGRARENRQKRRIEALDVLGGKCMACGLTDTFLLTFDHIYNDWEKDKVRRCDKVGLARWIINNPEEAKKRLQVLCWNDNALKEFYPQEFANRFPSAMTGALGS
jgi:endogenous inhibitor of DNA gyrase (YacG/DUF329 family)